MQLTQTTLKSIYSYSSTSKYSWICRSAIISLKIFGFIYSSWWISYLNLYVISFSSFRRSFPALTVSTFHIHQVKVAYSFMIDEPCISWWISKMVNSFVIFIEILKLCSQTGDFTLITVLELPPSRRIKKGDLLKPQHKTKFYNIRSKFTFSLNES